MSHLDPQFAALEQQLQSGVAAHLAYGRVVGERFGGRSIRSLAPEPVEHRWQRIVDALPDSPDARTRRLRHARQSIARHGLRRLRAGQAWHWQRALALVRRDTAAALDALGHRGFARVVGGVQTELGL